MKLISICAFLFLASAHAQGSCPASIWAKSVNGIFSDAKNYVQGRLPGPDNVLFIGDLTPKGDNTVIVVTAPANKNNKALDLIIGDAWLIIEDGADLEITSDDMVKDCKIMNCVTTWEKKTPAFNYKMDKPVTCGGSMCPKTCSGKHSCDYWGAEEDYSCKSLEEEYGCDCSGCNCKIDHKSCSNKLAKKRCNGRSCDEWIHLDSSQSITCKMLEKDFKCSCSGCSCKPQAKCSAKEKKMCTDAYKMPCQAGSKKTTCGSCMKGYASDGNLGCGKHKDCKALGKIQSKAGTATSQPVCGGDFKCKCAGGTAAMGLVCGKDGAEKCTTCMKGRKLVNGKCVVSTPCPGKCGLAAYKGDGNCDDMNNNCGCGYDGGDCCKQTVKGGVVKTAYCKICKCADPKYAGGCNGGCKIAKYKGDGNCDDGNNNCGCGYDGGDCCGPSVKKAYCKECKCLDPNYKPGACPGTCGAKNYKGDGNCDDNNNNCGCAYDGGDCCGPSVKKAYCKECKCLDPNYKAGGPSCGDKKYKGDGNCDDNNNNSGCAYDGGDCCPKTVQGGKVNTAYCKACKCLDPNGKYGKKVFVGGR